MTEILERRYADALPDYATVSIALEVVSVFDVTGSGPFVLTERRLDTPYVKDYDLAGDAPSEWGRRFDVSTWGFLLARRDSRVVGAAALAYDTPAANSLEGRRDLAELWDIRVSPAARGQGIGPTLVRAAEAWAMARGCTELKVETQNINVPACRFYERQGFTLRHVNRDVYPASAAHEIQFLWYKDLPPRPAQREAP